jgi:hypothetical protein
MASGNAVSTTHVRRAGRSVRVVSHASGSEMASAAAVTATARTIVSISTVRVRADVAIATVSVQPSSHTRTIR